MENIDIYYESLKQVHQQIMTWPGRKQPLHEKCIDVLLGGVIALVLLTLVPIVPALLVYFGSQANVQLGLFNMAGASIGTLLGAWVLASVISLALFVLSRFINDKIRALAKTRPGPPQTLSPEQLTFIAVYEAYKELKICFVSHVEQHVNNSLKSIERALEPSERYIERFTVVENHGDGAAGSSKRKEEALYID